MIMILFYKLYRDSNSVFCHSVISAAKCHDNKFLMWNEAGPARARGSINLGAAAYFAHFLPWAKIYLWRRRKHCLRSETNSASLVTRSGVRVRWFQFLLESESRFDTCHKSRSRSQLHCGAGSSYGTGSYSGISAIIENLSLRTSGNMSN